MCLRFLLGLFSKKSIHLVYTHSTVLVEVVARCPNCLVCCASGLAVAGCGSVFAEARKTTHCMCCLGFYLRHAGYYDLISCSCMFSGYRSDFLQHIGSMLFDALQIRVNLHLPLLLDP